MIVTDNLFGDITVTDLAAAAAVSAWQASGNIDAPGANPAMFGAGAWQRRTRRSGHRRPDGGDHVGGVIAVPIWRTTTRLPGDRAVEAHGHAWRSERLRHHDRRTIRRRALVSKPGGGAAESGTSGQGNNTSAKAHAVGRSPVIKLPNSSPAAAIAAA